MKVWNIVLAVLLTGCTTTLPQRPSQRSGMVAGADSAQLALIELNRRLATAADEQLRQTALSEDEPYALYERGVWAHVSEAGDLSRPIAKGGTYTLRVRTYSLSGQLYCDEEKTVHAGKYELPAGIEENMGEWHQGARIRMYVPWYAAYGVGGSEQIPPYENVIMEIELR